jgi:hypothetical protein
VLEGVVVFSRGVGCLVVFVSAVAARIWRGVSGAGG